MKFPNPQLTVFILDAMPITDDAVQRQKPIAVSDRLHRLDHLMAPQRLTVRPQKTRFITAAQHSLELLHPHLRHRCAIAAETTTVSRGAEVM